MEPVLRPAIAWLLALLMPFQALTAVYLDVRGPAHVHVTGDGARQDAESAPFAVAEREHARAHEYSHVVQALGLQASRGVHGHAHSHDGDGVERHHHHPGDASVVTIYDHGLAAEFALREETTSGWSGAMLVTLPAADLTPHSPAGVDALAPRPETPLTTRIPGRLDRPPRIITG